MSSLSSPTIFPQENVLLHFHSRRLQLHIPLRQSKPEADSPTTTNHQDRLDPYASQSNFDGNVIIVLSLVLCVLICSIVMKFIIKCALRGISPTPTASENPSTQLSNTGVKKKVINTFTTLKYSDGLKLPGLDSECAICLSEFKPSEKVRVLPKCNHGFHMRCIDRWLSQHSSCPTCRNCLIGACQKILICNQGGLPAPTPGLENECLICLSEFKSGERLRVLPKCNHGFHVRCIDRWLSQVNNLHVQWRHTRKSYFAARVAYQHQHLKLVWISTPH